MSKKNFLEQIEVKNPCSEDWNEMKGNDKARFCSHCKLNVNNLSALTRREALKIVRRSRGRICVRYVQNPVDKTPVFADRLHQITRRAAVAAGVLGASLTLSTLTFAQGSPRLIKRDTNTQTEALQVTESENDKTGASVSSISGTITDVAGAVIPGTEINLVNLNTNEVIVITSNEEGFYEFKDISSGTYAIKIEAARGFDKKEISAIRIVEGTDAKQDITLDAGVVMMGVFVTIEYSNPLHLAVAGDELEKVRMLIATGENVNSKDENYNDTTPLFLAVENGNAEIAETLLNFGAKVNARDENRQTPLMRLDEDASPELVRLLIKHGAKVNTFDKEGNTPLILAAENASAEVLQILIDHGAKINAQNKQGQTALMIAAYEDNLEKVKNLILAGANVNLKNKEDETAWDLTSDAEIEKLLESHGAKTEDN